MKYLVVICCIFLILNKPIEVSAQIAKYPFTRPKMGSPFTITVAAKDTTGLTTAIEKAFARVDTLNNIFSDYAPDSEINRLSQNAIFQSRQNLSPDLCRLLGISKKAMEASGGAYDVTIGRLTRLWRVAKKEKKLPSKSQRRLALQLSGFNNIIFDEKNCTIGFKNVASPESVPIQSVGGVLFDFGGIVKGFAAQEAVRIVSEAGFPMCMADAGGDLVLGDAPAGTQGWSIAITIPQSDAGLMPFSMLLHNQAIATSGDMYQSIEINGRFYAHILNPKTGLGVTHRRNITVIAADGATADWLATACSILPFRKAKRLIKKYAGAALLILENKGGKIISYQSPDFFKNR